MTGVFVLKIFVLQNLGVEYLQFQGGDFAPPYPVGYTSC